MTDQIPDYYKNLPKKRMASGALFFNDEGKILIVKPTYKDYWSIPGGVIDQDESPRQACIREIEEEIGLKDLNIKFVCVDYYPTKEGKDENLQFIFNGGILTSELINNIKLDKNELSEFKFVDTQEALSLVSERVKKRIIHSLDAIKNKTALYIEDGNIT